MELSRSFQACISIEKAYYYNVDYGIIVLIAESAYISLLTLSLSFKVNITFVKI